MICVKSEHSQGAEPSAAPPPWPLSPEGWLESGARWRRSSPVPGVCQTRPERTSALVSTYKGRGKEIEPERNFQTCFPSCSGFTFAEFRFAEFSVSGLSVDFFVFLRDREKKAKAKQLLSTQNNKATPPLDILLQV